MTNAIPRIATLLTLTILVSLLIATVATAETIFVDRFDDSNTATACQPFTGNDCSLRGAIIRANGNGEDDTIWIVMQGTYILSLDGSGNTLGDLDITDNLIIKGWSRSTVIIDASGMPGGDRIFDIHSGVSATIRDVKIKGGSGPPIGGQGAGIWNSGTLFLKNIDLRENTSPDHGGGIFNQTGAWLEIEQSTIYSNLAENSGGGVYNDGTLKVTDSRFLRNGAFSDGGGIFNNDGDVVILNRASMRYNNITSPGGGPGPGSGGAIFNKGWVNVINSYFWYNSAMNNAGGAIANRSELDLSNTTFTNNYSPNGSAIHSETSSQVNMVNTIIDDECAVDPNWFTSFGGNVESPGHTCPLDPQSDLWDVADVMFGPIGFNGGFSKSQPLLQGSPAIDVGNDLLCETGDQRRQPRPIDGDGDLDPKCDAGSNEYNPAEIFLSGFEWANFDPWSEVVGR